MPLEIIRPGTRIDFIGRWRLWVGISLAESNPPTTSVAVSDWLSPSLSD